MQTVMEMKLSQVRKGQQKREDMVAEFQNETRARTVLVDIQKLNDQVEHECTKLP